MEPMMRALVLAGGGLTGIGWEVGVLAGLSEQDVQVGRTSDLIIGTSAGSVVGTRVAQGANLADLYAEQLADPFQSGERTASLDATGLAEIFELMLSDEGEPKERRAQVGALALAANTISEEERLQVIASRLPSREWPAVRLQIVAVDAGSGETAIFDAASGVQLLEAVAASCAVPGVWPPVSIGDSRYIDGGVRSTDNADLAAGFDRVLVLSPMRMPVAGVALIEATGSAAVVYPDDDSVDAMGANPLDPAFRAPAAAAGFAQAAALAPDIAEFWSD